jgi:hypothetical protein
LSVCNQNNLPKGIESERAGNDPEGKDNKKQGGGELETNPVRVVDPVRVHFYIHLNLNQIKEIF